MHSRDARPLLFYGGLLVGAAVYWEVMEGVGEGGLRAVCLQPRARAAAPATAVNSPGPSSDARMRQLSQGGFSEMALEGPGAAGHLAPGQRATIACLLGVSATGRKANSQQDQLDTESRGVRCIGSNECWVRFKTKPSNCEMALRFWRRRIRNINKQFCLCSELEYSQQNRFQNF